MHKYDNTRQNTGCYVKYIPAFKHLDKAATNFRLLLQLKLVHFCLYGVHVGTSQTGAFTLFYLDPLPHSIGRTTTLGLPASLLRPRQLYFPIFSFGGLLVFCFSQRFLSATFPCSVALSPLQYPQFYLCFY